MRKPFSQRSLAALTAVGITFGILAVPMGSVSAAPRSVGYVSYRTCAALNVAFPDGIAARANYLNRGDRIYGAPTVNGRLYQLNTHLDRDRDGISCEDITPDPVG